MLIPVILSGGAGSRLWPASRRAYPKPFMTLPDGETLALKTLRRAARLGDGHVMTVTGQDHHLLTRTAYARFEADLTHHFVLEPLGRNTAPAIAAAAQRVVELFGPDTLMLVMPADHLIEDVERFAQTVQAGQRLAEQGLLVTFGITPSAPETGYGYIRRGKAREPGFEVETFVEKPDAATAQHYLDTGEYFWNAGIFCFAAQSLLDAVAKFEPQISETLSEMDLRGAEPLELAERSFARMPDISIDYAVMERADNVAVVPLDARWNDIGSWRALASLAEPDADLNRIVGEAVLHDCQGVYVQSPERLTAVIGLKDVIVVDTGDALLVADASRDQDVKQIVEELKREQHRLATDHYVEYLDWGQRTQIAAGVFEYQLSPGASLQLERPQQWSVVHGEVCATPGGAIKAGQAAALEPGRVHSEGGARIIVVESQAESNE